MTTMRLEVLPGQYTIHRFPRTATIPEGALNGPLTNISLTADEMSIVCESDNPVESEGADEGWVALKVKGPLDLDSIGVLARLASTLAEAGVAIFAMSTYDTDYLLVPGDNLGIAMVALQAGGYEVVSDD